MLTEIIMPKAGSEMEEGQIVKWLKKEGDVVKEGEIILEIMTDKVNMEIEAEASGILLKILKHDGEIVPVITTIAYIGDEGDIIPDNEKIESSENTLSYNDDKEKSSEKETVDNLIKSDEKDISSKYEYDIFVIGGGPAGYYSAIKFAQKGMKVALAENNKFGGTCLNRGCIPTKTYLQTVEDIERIKSSNKRGIVLDIDNLGVDISKSLKFKNGIVKKLSTGVEFLLKSNFVDLYKEKAYIQSNNLVKLESGKEISTDKIIFAGGSKCVKNIKGSNINKVIDTDEALDLNTVPKSITIIGAGYIGIEMAQIFNSFGSKVTVVEKNEKAISKFDSEISLILINLLEKSGISFIFNKDITEIKEQENGNLSIISNNNEVSNSEYVLTTSREANLSALKDVNIEIIDGNIKVNDNFETNIEGIYAIGDVNGKNLLAHAAFKMGDEVSSVVLSNKNNYNNNFIPNAIYTYPEIAYVGITEEEAMKNYDVKVGRFSYGANGRALAYGESSGLVKIISDSKYGEILGAHIVGPRASELINEVALLMQSEMTVQEVIKMVFGHPTFSEAIYEAFSDIESVSVHLPKK